MVRSAAAGAVACAALLLAASGCGRTLIGPVDRPDREVTETVIPDPFVVGDSGIISGMARDAGHVYWVGEEGLFRRPLGGADAGTPTPVSEEMAGWGVTAMAVGGGRVFVTDGASVAMVPTSGGDIVSIAVMSVGILGLVADDSHIFIATEHEILRVRVPARPSDDHDMLPDPVPVATDQDRIGALTLAGDHVYWSDRGPDSPPSGEPASYPGTQIAMQGDGAIRRIGVDGGRIEDIATDLDNPGAIAVAGDRVYWCNERGPAVLSVPVAGGAIRAELRGKADAVIADAGGLVVRGLQGHVVERRADGAAYIRLMTDSTWFPTGGPMAVTDEWLYVVAVRSADGRAAVMALPRLDRRVEIATTLDDTALRLRLRDGTLYLAEQPRDGTYGIRFVRVDPDSGNRTVLGRHEGWLSEMTVGPGQIYFADDYVIYRLPLAGGAVRQFHRTDSYVTGLTPHRNHLFWLNGYGLWTMKRTGGPAFEIARADNGYGGGEANTDLVFDDDYVYLTTFGYAGTGVYRISERGQVTLLWDAREVAYPSKDLVKFGDELYFQAGGSVYQLDLEGVSKVVYRSRGDGSIADLGGGGGMLYLLITGGEYSEIVRIDPGSGDSASVLRWNVWGNDTPTMLVDDGGIYVYIEPFDAVVHLAHDVRPVLAPGWPKHDE